MKKTIVIFLASSILVSSCASTTQIQTFPNGANIYVDDQRVGNTPYLLKDKKITGKTTRIKIEKDGYETLETSIKKNEKVHVGALLGGIFIFFPLLLWTMKYEPLHNYSLNEKKSTENINDNKKDEIVNQKSKADRLRDLKKLLDEKVISQEEFEIEKSKILNE